MRKSIKMLMLASSILLSGCGDANNSATSATMQVSSYDETNNSIDTDADDTDDAGTIMDEEDSIDEGNILEDEDNVEETGTEDIPSAKPKGIIAMIHEYTYTSVFYETIISINPKNGQVKLIAKFPNSIKKLGIIHDPEGGVPGYANFRHLFSDDYSKRATIKYFSEDNSSHAGWLDTDGNFFDVSKAAGEVPKSDFAEKPNHMVAGFTWDGLFAYRTVFKATIPIYHIVDPDNLSKGKYKKVKNVWDRHATVNDPDLKPTDWINDTRCLADYYIGASESMTGMCNSVQRNSVIFDTKSKKIIEYIPGANSSRNNWSGVVSPNGKKIAFLSKLSGNSDVGLYITSPKGGEPVKLEVDAPDEQKLRLEEVGTSSTIYCTLLDWK